MTLEPELGAIYRGFVMHHRRRPVDHKFTYPVMSLFLDIDRLEETARALRFFSVDRFSLLAIHRCDHGARDGSDLRPWVQAQLRASDLPGQPARIMLLSMPRLLGYMFNPLSIYFCYDQNNSLESIVYQVKNTFGGQHIYALNANANANAGQGSSVMAQSCPKSFFVSPFIDMNARYHFRLKAPGERLSFAIRETDKTGCFFVATHTGQRLELSDRQLWRCISGYGFLGIKVMAGIHLEAFKLWLKGAPYFSRDLNQG